MGPGDSVRWLVGRGRIFEHEATGTVVETGLEKFGHDDVIRGEPDVPNDHPTYIRPEDVLD